MSDQATLRQIMLQLLTIRIIEMRCNFFQMMMRDSKFPCASIECQSGVSVAKIQQSNGAV